MKSDMFHPRAKIYVTNAPLHLDFSTAEQFGELVNLTAGPVNPFAPEVAKRQVEAGLAQFDASKDYLLLAGAALSVGFAFAYLCLHGDADIDDVKIKLLLFDNKTQNYIIKEVCL